MRIIFLITLSFIINIYAQFTSGTDYSGMEEETEKAKTTFGTVVYAVKSDIKWEFVKPDDISFNANSNMTGFGYGFFLNIPNENYEFLFKADHIYRDVSNSASKKEYVTEGEDPVYSGIDVNDFSISQIRTESGMEFMRRYKFTVKADYVSADGDNSIRFGGTAGYKADIGKRQFITVGMELNSEVEKELLAISRSYSEISPNQLYAIGFIKELEAAKLNSVVKYLKYNSSKADNRETDYINFELGYDRSFKRAGTDVSLSAGSNLTKDLESPMISLPYFYYKVSFGTEFLNNKIGLNIGWNYGMYEIALSDRISIQEEDLLLLPEGVEGITEKIGAYTLDIKLSYRF
ncbi:MAG: hypothetical protein JXN63_01900 [Candidatus Delongbacteria bacterium]|nr:hypothetical protein [Candidatus Delongbacteria bacterium]